MIPVIHKIHNVTPFKLKTVCGIYPEKEHQITSENWKVTCKRCKSLISKQIKNALAVT